MHGAADQLSKPFAFDELVTEAAAQLGAAIIDAEQCSEARAKLTRIKAQVQEGRVQPRS